MAKIPPPPPPELPNNKSLAEHRLKLLKRRLTKDPLLHGKYTEFMDDLLRKGYAKRVHIGQPEEPSTPAWYLPHHPVFHPQKPDKVRVVFDCAAKYRGTSLNDQLLQGPDLTISLVGVLTRFREESVALMYDVEAMFHEVKVRPDDCNAPAIPGVDRRCTIVQLDPKMVDGLLHIGGRLRRARSTQSSYPNDTP